MAAQTAFYCDRVLVLMPRSHITVCSCARQAGG